MPSKVTYNSEIHRKARTINRENAEIAFVIAYEADCLKAKICPRCGSNLSERTLDGEDKMGYKDKGLVCVSCDYVMQVLTNHISY
jgi:hypothetical protein